MTKIYEKHLALKKDAAVSIDGIIGMLKELQYSILFIVGVFLRFFFQLSKILQITQTVFDCSLYNST